MFNDNFIVAQNPTVSFFREVLDVLIGILFIILFLKLIIFLISYIYKAIKMAVTSIFGEVSSNISKPDISSERQNRKPKYKNEIKSHKSSRSIKVKNIETNVEDK